MVYSAASMLHVWLIAELSVLFYYGKVTMYVCICVCMSVCLSVYMYVYMYVYMFIFNKKSPLEN